MAIGTVAIWANTNIASSCASNLFTRNLFVAITQLRRGFFPLSPVSNSRTAHGMGHLMQDDLANVLKWVQIYKIARKRNAVVVVFANP